MKPESRVRDRYQAAQWAKELTMREDWVILDTETTGLHNAEIVQIGVLSGSGKVLLESLIKPTISIPHKASIIHGITDAQVCSAPAFPEVYPYLIDSIANKAIVIYNAKFDKSILRYCCNIAGIKPPGLTELHCVMHWYAKWMGDWSDYHCNYKWPKLPGGDHTAIGDCYATLRVIQSMANSFMPKSEATRETVSQKSSIFVLTQKVDCSEHQHLSERIIETHPNQDEQIIKTNNKSESLLAQAPREVCKDISSLDIENDAFLIRKEGFTQVNNAAELILKEDLVKGNQQIKNNFTSYQKNKSSRYIDPQQIQIYMNARELGLKRSDAACIAGFSERTGHRIESGTYRLSRREVRDWKTRLDPLAEVWEFELVPLLQDQPQLTSVQLLKHLQRTYSDKYTNSVLRTLQRRVHNWRLEQGLLQNKTLENEQLVWMQRLQNGRIEFTELEIKFANKLESNMIHFLLDHIRNSSLQYRNRALTILFYLKGIPEHLIAQFLMLDTRTIRRYINKYETYGAKKLIDFSRKEIKKSKDPKFIDKVFEILHSPPSFYSINRTSWTIKDLHRVMSELGFGIAQSNIRQIIKDAGYKFRKAKKVLTSTDPNYREKLQNITQILSTLRPKDKFFSIDEFGPFSVKMQGGRSLMPPGEVKVVPQWQQSKGQLIMTAALELSTNQVTHFYSEKKNTEEMIKLLDRLLEKYADEDYIYISWDAASWHASKELYKKVDEVNSPEYRKERNLPIVKLAPLPASAQFLNIIESVFSGMARAIIHNSDYQSVEECKDAIDRYFSERNQYFIEHPKRAGNKIWGEELVEVEFKESNNCKDPRWR